MSGRWLAVSLGICITAAAARAAPAELRFHEAVGLAGELPALVAVREAAAAERRIAVPRPWSSLVFEVTPRLRLAPERDRGAEGGVRVQQAFPLGDVRGARRALLEANADVRVAMAAAEQLEARLSAASTWIDGWAARERLAAAERDLELARAVLAITDKGTKAGAFTAPELADARAFVAEAEVRRIDAEGQVADAGFALARATARTGRIAAAGALPEVPLPEHAAWPALLARAAKSPDVVARRMAARAARARAVEERAARGTQLIVGGELVKDAPDGWVAGVTLGIGLPHDRGQREARQAEVEARLADTQAAALATNATVELDRALHEVAHTSELLAQLRDALVPAADDAAARRQRAFEVGETTTVELLAARRVALAAHVRLADARAAHAWARVRAWLLLSAAEVSP